MLHEVLTWNERRLHLASERKGTVSLLRKVQYLCTRNSGSTMGSTDGAAADGAKEDEEDEVVLSVVAAADASPPPPSGGMRTSI